MAALLGSYQSQTDPESETSELEHWVRRESAVAGGRTGRRVVLAAMALLGAAAVAVVAASSFNRSPEAAEVPGGQPLSPLEMEEISAQLQELEATTAHAVQAATSTAAAAAAARDNEEATPAASAFLPPMTDAHDMTAYRAWASKKNCKANEELFMGLCYKKCALLTGGTHPFRSSGWGCCKSEKCNLRSIKVEVGICSGFSVSGDGISCPRQMGYCLDDEEMFLGLCYKKCSILTKEMYNFRVTPVTCCRTEGLACLHPSLSDTSFGHFASGNFTEAEGDHANVSYKIAHPPLTIMTTYTSTTVTTITETSTSSTTSSSSTTVTETTTTETSSTSTTITTTVPPTTVAPTTVATWTTAAPTTVAPTTVAVAETTVAETTTTAAA